MLGLGPPPPSPFSVLFEEVLMCVGGKNLAPSVTSSKGGCPLLTPMAVPQPPAHFFPRPKPELGSAGMNWVMQLVLQP